MKKILVFISIIILVQAACATSAAPNTTQTAQSATDIAAAWTATPDFTGVINPQGADLYAGPAENYPVIGFVLDNVKIVGQAYNCTWFFVTVPANNLTGWLNATNVSYTVRCADIAASTIPPTPNPTATITRIPSATFTLIPTATRTKTPVPTSKPSGGGSSGGGGQASCPLQDSLTLGNRTGAYGYFTLVGPATINFELPPDQNSSIKVCEGCYDLYVSSSGCGGGGGYMGRICSGFNGWIECVGP
jgi:hypothetical protein